MGAVSIKIPISDISCQGPVTFDISDCFHHFRTEPLLELYEKHIAGKCVCLLQRSYNDIHFHWFQSWGHRVAGAGLVY